MYWLIRRAAWATALLAMMAFACTGHAATQSTDAQKAVRAATFEVVLRKQDADPLSYEKPLPLDEAVATFTSILELAPKDRYSLNERVDALLGAGNFAQAVSYSGEIVAAFPEDPAARSNYARLLRVQHRPEESVAQAAALANLEPAQRNALVAAASIYEASRKSAEAMQAINRAVAVFPSETTKPHGRGDPPASCAAKRSASACVKKSTRSDAPLRLRYVSVPAIYKAESSAR